MYFTLCNGECVVKAIDDSPPPPPHDGMWWRSKKRNVKIYTSGSNAGSGKCEVNWGNVLIAEQNVSVDLVVFLCKVCCMDSLTAVTCCTVLTVKWCESSCYSF